MVTILEFLGMQLALDAKEDVSLAAPMIGQVTGRIFYHSHPDATEVLGTPIGGACFSLPIGFMNSSNKIPNESVQGASI